MELDMKEDSRWWKDIHLSATTSFIFPYAPISRLLGNVVRVELIGQNAVNGDSIEKDEKERERERERERQRERETFFPDLVSQSEIRTSFFLRDYSLPTTVQSR